MALKLTSAVIVGKDGCGEIDDAYEVEIDGVADKLGPENLDG